MLLDLSDQLAVPPRKHFPFLTTVSHHHPYLPRTSFAFKFRKPIGADLDDGPFRRFVPQSLTPGGSWILLSQISSRQGMPEDPRLSGKDRKTVFLCSTSVAIHAAAESAKAPDKADTISRRYASAYSAN
jgi:hypothetical protein